MEPRIAFATRKDGVHIAYATLGEGPPIVYPPGAFSRIEAELPNPRFREFYDAIATDHMLVLWDRHGVGHSDRDRTDFSYDDDVLDMEAVVDALGLGRFAVFGISDGGPIALTYAARYPDRVACLILYGTAAISGDAASRRAIGDLFRTDWWLGTRALVLMMTPSAPEAAAIDLSRILSETSSAEVAADLWEMGYNVKELIPRITAPALVLHRQDDKVVPFELGREMASLLPNARFVPLTGENHPPSIGDWQAVFDPMMTFLHEEESGQVALQAQPRQGSSHLDIPLSERELEVLSLLASGLSSREIGEALTLSVRTVERHIGNIYFKTNTHGRVQATAFAIARRLI